MTSRHYFFAGPYKEPLGVAPGPRSLFALAKVNSAVTERGEPKHWEPACPIRN